MFSSSFFSQGSSLSPFHLIEYDYFMLILFIFCYLDLVDTSNLVSCIR